MKKIYTLIAVALAAAGIASAQQLPVANPEITTKDIGSFDGLWPECKPNGGNTVVGNQPTGWSASNVHQSIMSFYLVSQNIKDRTSTNANTYSVDLTNKYCGIGKFGATAPAYITLGSAWNYGNIEIEKSDGGSYGGIEFTYRPDAISLWIKRTHSTEATNGKINTEEKASVILYSWKGETSSSVKVGFNSVQATTMINRDRDVLGMITEGVTKSEGFELVSQSKNLIEGDFEDWKQFVFDIDYKTTTVKPEKLNIIISAANYFDDRANIGEGNYLNVDDVSFVYYSTLSKLSIGGRKINLVEGEYSYEVVGTMPESEDDVVATTKGNFAETKVTLNTESKTVTITVTNQGGEDIDGKTEHVYTIIYKDPISTNTYPGYLNIAMMGNTLAYNQPTTVQIDVVEENKKCTFLLPDFNFQGSPMGDIVVEDVTMATDENGTAYTGNVEGLELGNGAIIANVSIEGNITADNNVDFKISVVWTNAPSPLLQNIDVTFSSIKTVKEEKEYAGYLCINETGNISAKVEIAEYGDGTCKFTLPDFCFSGQQLGDIVVEDVTMVENGGIVTYKGTATGLDLKMGVLPIEADVIINGTIDAEDNVDFKIDVTCTNAPGGTPIPINVSFSTNKTVTSTDNHEGFLNIKMGEGETQMQLVTNEAKKIQIANYGDNTCKFTLSNFNLPSMNLELGDIVVDNVTITTENGISTYSGEAENMQFMQGSIIADVNVNGTIENDVVDFKIDVKWHNDETVIPIFVTFTTNKVYETEEYTGYLNVEMEDKLLVENQEDVIEILQTGDNNCTFTLPDFQISLGEGLLPLGDIIVENVSMTEENGNTTYKGAADGMKLMNGTITANVDINGTISADGKVDFKIDVLWVDSNLPIAVTFTSNKVEHTLVNDITANNNAIYGTIGAIAINGYVGKADIYGITGQLVKSIDIDSRTMIDIESGIYIVRIANATTKVMVK